MDPREEEEKTNWLSLVRPCNLGDYINAVESNRKDLTNNHIYRKSADKLPSPAPSSSKLERATIDENTMKTNSCHSEVDNSEKMKTKLMSMWNNVKYGWTVKVKTNFSYESPIWLLGKCYHKKLQGQYNNDFAAKNSSMELFKQDFSSRIWFTYRREFPTLAGSNLTTDCGWGCMLRSGQMLLAQALVCHFLGRDWRWNSFQTPLNDVYHRMIIKWFADHPCSSSPFSVHKLVSLGENSGKKAGEWYGPASVAYILKQAVEIAAKKIPLLDSVCVYVAQDCTIYQQDVFDLCTALQRKRSFCENSLSDEKQNPSSKSCCCGDDKNNIFGSNSTSSYLKNSSIKFNDINHSNIDYKKREERWEPPKFTSVQENPHKMHEKVSDDSFINPHLFNENSKELCSTSNNYNPLKMNQKDHNIQTRTSTVYDSAKKAEVISKENFSAATNSSVFCNSVNSLTAFKKLDDKNIRPKENSCGERKSFLLRSASVPPSSSEETSYLSTNEDSSNEYNAELCINSNNSNEYCSRWKSVIILVPVRLGGEILNRTYIPRVRDVLTQEHCIGIIGGRPRHSLYFIGWQDDKLIYLDPHYCQEVVDICTTDFPLQSFHCTAPRKMTCTRMDPSCTIGFYCRTKKDFLNFTKAINQILAPYKQKGDYPIFTLQEGKCSLATLESEIIARERSESLEQSWTFENDLDTIEINNEDFVVI